MATFTLIFSAAIVAICCLVDRCSFSQVPNSGNNFGRGFWLNKKIPCDFTLYKIIY